MCVYAKFNAYWYVMGVSRSEPLIHHPYEKITVLMYVGSVYVSMRGVCSTRPRSCQWWLVPMSCITLVFTFYSTSLSLDVALCRVAPFCFNHMHVHAIKCSNIFQKRKLTFTQWIGHSKMNEGMGIDHVNSMCMRLQQTTLYWCCASYMHKVCIQLCTCN